MADPREEDKVVQQLTELNVNTDSKEEEVVDQPAAGVAIRASALNESEAKPVITVEENSPYQLANITQFSELNLAPDILEGVAAKGYNRPSQIQALAIPAILANPPQNFFGQAQSGSGKTAAFGLSMLARVDRNVESVQAICIAPTRELTRQIHENIFQLAKCTKIRVLLVLPDTYQKLPSTLIKDQIIVSTPGTLLKLLDSPMLSHGKISCKIFVLDEADELLKLQGGEENQAKTIIRRVNPKQICLFSATYNDKVKDFATRLAKFPIKIEIPPEKLSLDKLYQFFIKCADEKGNDVRLGVLEKIVSTVDVGQTIIFVHTIETGKRVYNVLKNKGHNVSLLYGKGMEETQRDRIIDAFRKGEDRTLISTNVIARGLDVLKVSLVINYDVPMDRDKRPDPETYLHRIGRSARWKNPGLAITFVHDRDSFEKIKAIADHFHRKIEERERNSVENLTKELREMGIID